MTKTAPYHVIYGDILNTPLNQIVNENTQQVVEETVDTINDKNITLKLP